MFDIGFWELVLVALVALIVVGPERLPKLIRVTGLWIGRAHASLQNIRQEIAQELRAQELKQALDKTVDLHDIEPGIQQESHKTSQQQGNSHHDNR